MPIFLLIVLSCFIRMHFVLWWLWSTRVTHFIWQKLVNRWTLHNFIPCPASQRIQPFSSILVWLARRRSDTKSDWIYIFWLIILSDMTWHLQIPFNSRFTCFYYPSLSSTSEHSLIGGEIDPIFPGSWILGSSTNNNDALLFTKKYIL